MPTNHSVSYSLTPRFPDVWSNVTTQSEIPFCAVKVTERGCVGASARRRLNLAHLVARMLNGASNEIGAWGAIT